MLQFAGCACGKTEQAGSQRDQGVPCCPPPVPAVGQVCHQSNPIYITGVWSRTRRARDASCSSLDSSLCLIAHHLSAELLSQESHRGQLGALPLTFVLLCCGSSTHAQWKWDHSFPLPGNTASPKHPVLLSAPVSTCQRGTASGILA